MLPKTLFRFRPNNSDHDFKDELNHAVNLHQVYCASIDVQNDRFDSLPHYEMSSHEEILHFVNGFQEKYGPDKFITNESISEMAHKLGIINTTKIDEFRTPESKVDFIGQHKFGKFIEDRKHYKIACFSKSIDSKSMWEKYANANQGVCLEYDTRVNSEGLYSNPKLMKVEYVTVMPTVTSLEIIKFASSRSMKDQTFFSHDEALQLLRHTHCTKTKDWECEKEWRWIEDVDGDARYRDMLPMKVVSITVGVEACDKTIDLCVDVARGHIPVYQMQVSENAFKLNRELL